MRLRLSLRPITRQLIALDFIALSILFLAVNRGAYRGYFDAADFQNIAAARETSTKALISALVSPTVNSPFTHPVGGLMYAVLGPSMHFASFVTWVHALHLLTAVVLYLWLRRLRFEPVAAFAGAAFFALNVAAFESFWQPSHVFEVSCALLCALTLLLWTHDQWILSIICFWFACKSADAALMLPCVLAAYEYFLGERRWRHLAPLFALMLLFGAQSISASGGHSVATSHLGFASLLWLPVVLAPLYARDNRAWFGLSAFCLLMAALAFLPGVWIYVPSLGLAVLAASFLRKPAFLGIFFALWLPLSLFGLRNLRVPIIAAQNEIRSYADTVQKSIESDGTAQFYIVDGAPGSLGVGGIRSLLKTLAPDAAVYQIDEPATVAAAREPSLALLRWHPEWQALRITTRTAATPLAAYITMDTHAPFWQLEEGWYGYEGSYRWSAPRARATLQRPSAARTFEVRVNAGEQLMQAQKQVRIEVVANNKSLGERTISAHGLSTLSWPLDDLYAGPVSIELRTSPAYQADPSRPLGIAVQGLGYK